MNLKRKIWISGAEKRAINNYFDNMAKAYSIIAKNERANTAELQAQKELIDSLLQDNYELREEINKLKAKKTTKKQPKLEEMN